MSQKGANSRGLFRNVWKLPHRIHQQDRTIGCQSHTNNGGVEVDGVTVPPNPIFRKGGWFSSEPAVAPRLQMRGLETISAAGRNDRGPDSFLVRVRGYSFAHVVGLRTVTQCQLDDSSHSLCFEVYVGPA